METKEVSILKCIAGFRLGMVMKHKEIDTPLEYKVSTGVSFLFTVPGGYEYASLCRSGFFGDA